MKRKTKIMISALSVMLLMALSVTALSLSFADNSDLASQLVAEEKAVAAGATAETNVDLIIENSNDTEIEDSEYHIVEISSNGKSNFENYTKKTTATDGSVTTPFGLYVLDGNHSDALPAGVSMNNAKVDFKFFTVADAAKNLDVVLKADLIYISNDAAGEFKIGNDMSEDLYDVLHTYALGSYKPLIIDNPSAKQIVGPTSTKALADLSKKVYTKSGHLYYTFDWNDGTGGLTPEEYLQHAKGSLYIGVNGAKASANWLNVKSGGDAKKAARILTLSADGTTATRTTALITGTTIALTDLDGNAISGTGLTPDAARLDLLYNKNYGTKPDFFVLENKKISDIVTDNVDLTAYDFVILEGGLPANVDSDVYKKLSGAMYANVHIVYNSKDLGGSSGGSSDSGTASMTTKYDQLFYLCAYEDFTSKYDNVMVTNRADFDDVLTSSDAGTGSVIANLINKSNYRGNGGHGGSSANKYTVLEIQPCYPIDRNVAKNVGKAVARNSTYETQIKNLHGDDSNYYTKPAQVKNGVTLEDFYDGALYAADGTTELFENYDGATNQGLAGFTSTTEYYAWEVSPAKIADALGIDVADINVVHMSSEELCSYKGDILGNYDMVYIGGNTSALKEPNEWGLFWTVLNDQTHWPNPGDFTGLPIYSMYSHFGDFASVSGGGWGRSGDSTDSGTPVAKVKVNGSYVDSFVTMNGNDISYVNMTGLQDFIKAGMPVIVSNKAAAAYDAAVTATDATGKLNPYLQNSIDPDSNMYKVLASAKAATTTTSWGEFETTPEGYVKTILRSTDGGRLGATPSGYVRVWAGDKNGTKTAFGDYPTLPEVNPIRDVYNKSNHRPVLLVKSAPATYNQHDEGTKLTGKQTWNYKVSGSTKYKVELIIDNDGNSKFDDPAVATGGDGSTKVTWEPGEFFGPFYWQLKVTDTTTKVVTSSTGIGYIKNKNNKKQTIKVMQILPATYNQYGNSTGSTGAQGTNTLYFCPMCDQASDILHYNAMDNTSYKPLSMAYNGFYNYYQTSDGKGGSVYYGTHEHEFGIVKFDNNKVYLDDETNTRGVDDWNDNLADQVSDLYDFDLDIVDRTEFERMSQEVADAYDFSKWTTDQKRNKISSFAIATTDKDYATWAALTTDDERLAFIMKKEYAEQASHYQQAYLFMRDESGTKVVDGYNITITTHDAEEKMVEALRDMKNHLSAASAEFQTRYNDKIDWIIDHKRYSDFYNYIGVNDKWGPSANYQDTYKALGDTYKAGGKNFYDDYYLVYMNAKDKELEYKALYNKYRRLAAGDTWLKDVYNCVIIGPADNFNGDDITNVNALDQLEYYASHNGNMLLFHDLLSKNADKGSVQFTKRLRKYFGNDRYMVQDYDTAPTAGQYYVKYTTGDDRHFMSSLSSKPATDTTRYTGWETELRNTHMFGYKESALKTYLSAVQYTDPVAITNDNSGNYVGAIPYRYADLDWKLNAQWGHSHPFDSRTNKNYGTIRATKNNDGIITLFPFTLADDIYIGGTHPQAYALDIESPNMTVWYSLAGCDNAKEGSSYYAADPNDGMDNYFIYSYGNVSFCGAGHNFVTGPGRNNNDERMLYINIVCNSVRKSVNGPKLLLYDRDAETNSDVKEVETEDADYEYKVDDEEAYPEFSFKVTAEQGATLDSVKIYYDLDYSETNKLNEYSTDKFDDTGYPKHVLIADWDAKDIKNGVAKLGFRRVIKRTDGDLEKYYTDPAAGETTGHTISDTYVDNTGATITFGATALKLKPRYFSYYNNEYTYIVVCATYVDGETGAKVPIYKRMKIKLKPYLYDLT